MLFSDSNRLLKIVITSFVISILYAHPVQALESYFSGFGTLGVACFTANDVDFFYNEIPTGPGRSGECDHRLDSKLGIQLDMLLNEVLTTTLQVTSYHRADDSFDPQVTLANLKWDVSSALSWRIGRLQNPAFLLTEYRNVHYAQPMIRPPTELYGLATFFTLDGVEALYKQTVGDWSMELQAGFSSTRYDVLRRNQEGVDELEADIRYLFTSFEQLPWQFKLGYSEGRVSFKAQELQPLFEGLTMAGFFSLASDLDIDHKKFTLTYVGARYEKNNWLVMGELASRSVNGYFKDGKGAYLMLGRRFGRWLPYSIVARRWPDQRYSDDSIPLGLAPELDQLSIAVNGLLTRSTQIDHYSYSLGLSHEVSSQMTLKLQLDWINPDDQSFGAYINESSAYDFESPDTELLYSINLDFVF